MRFLTSAASMKGNKHVRWHTCLLGACEVGKSGGLPDGKVELVRDCCQCFLKRLENSLSPIMRSQGCFSRAAWQQILSRQAATHGGHETTHSNALLRRGFKMGNPRWSKGCCRASQCPVGTLCIYYTLITWETAVCSELADLLQRLLKRLMI